MTWIVFKFYPFLTTRFSKINIPVEQSGSFLWDTGLFWMEFNQRLNDLPFSAGALCCGINSAAGCLRPTKEFLGAHPSECTLNPHHPFLPSLTHLLSGHHQFALYSQESVGLSLSLYFPLFVLFLKFPIWVNPKVFLSDLFYWALFPLGPSVVLEMARFHVLGLSNILSYIYICVCVPHLLYPFISW